MYGIITHMKRIDLKQAIGLPVVYQDGVLTTQDCEFGSNKSYELEYILKQLLNDQVTLTEPVYSKYMRLDTSDTLDQMGLRFNEYVIAPNLIGIEYIKTKAVMTPKLPKVLEVHAGSGVVILQQIKNGLVTDVIISRIKTGQKVIVPGGYMMALVNNRQNQPFIVGEFHSTQSKNYTVLDDIQGMAYYVIRKNAKQEMVQNPVYREVPTFRRVKWDEIAASYKISLKTPFLKQILRKADKYGWLFTENSVKV